MPQPSLYVLQARQRGYFIFNCNIRWYLHGTYDGIRLLGTEKDFWLKQAFMPVHHQVKLVTVRGWVGWTSGFCLSPCIVDHRKQFPWKYWYLSFSNSAVALLSPPLWVTQASRVRGILHVREEIQTLPLENPLVPQNCKTETKEPSPLLKVVLRNITYSVVHFKLINSFPAKQ